MVHLLAFDSPDTDDVFDEFRVRLQRREDATLWQQHLYHCDSFLVVYQYPKHRL